MVVCSISSSTLNVPTVMDTGSTANPVACTDGVLLVGASLWSSVSDGEGGDELEEGDLVGQPAAC